MNKRIKVNGVLYEAVSPRGGRSGGRRRRRLVESTYQEVSPLGIGLDPLPDGDGPFAYTDSGDAYQVECSLGRATDSSSINEFLFVDGIGRNRYELECGDCVGDSFSWDDDRKDVLDTFEDLCREVAAVDLDDPESSDDFERIADDFGLEVRLRRR